MCLQVQCYDAGMAKQLTVRGITDEVAVVVAVQRTFDDPAWR